MPDDGRAFGPRPWPMLKICGIRTVAEGLAAAAGGANTIGLLAGLTHRSEDAVDEVSGRRIRDAVKAAAPNTRVLLVTHLLDAGDAAALARGIGADGVQVHDHMAPEDVAELRRLLPGREIVKAVHVSGSGRNAAEAAVEAARPYVPWSDALLTDSVKIDDDGVLRIGGTGVPNDPKAAAALKEAYGLPVVVAGGLRPGNVAEAARISGADGVDVNSGVENADGTKSPAKMAEFVREGRRGIEEGKAGGAEGGAAAKAPPTKPSSEIPAGRIR